jgi:hypothetical protein
MILFSTEGFVAANRIFTKLYKVEYYERYRLLQDYISLDFRKKLIANRADYLECLRPKGGTPIVVRIAIKRFNMLIVIYFVGGYTCWFRTGSQVVKKVREGRIYKRDRIGAGVLQAFRNRIRRILRRKVKIFKIAGVRIFFRTYIKAWMYRRLFTPRFRRYLDKNFCGEDRITRGHNTRESEKRWRRPRR